MHGASVQVYTELFTDATPERLEALFKYLDRDNSGVVDFLSWSRGLRLQDVPQAGPPAAALWLAPTAACWAVHRGVGPGLPVLVARPAPAGRAAGEAPLPRACSWRQQQPAGTVHCAVRPVVEQAPLHSPPASIGWCARRNRAVLFVGLGAASAAGTVQCCMQPMHVLHPMAAASPGRACPCQQLQQARWWLAVGPVLQAGLARLPCRAQVQAAGGRTVLSGRG
jgi:hypothetical protein